MFSWQMISFRNKEDYRWERFEILVSDRARSKRLRRLKLTVCPGLKFSVPPQCSLRLVVSLFL